MTRMFNWLCRTGVASLALSLCSPPAHSAGLWLYEMGTPDVGTASAGMASRADDAATAFANPAGMTRLTESQFMAGVQPIYANIKFDTRSATFGGGNGGNAGGLVPTGSLSYVRNVSNDFKLGVTAGSYLGLGVKFDNSWAGRYYIQQEEFATSFLNGAFGYKVNDWLSVGGGLSLVYGQLGVQTNINNVVDPTYGDGRLKFKDTDTDAGWNAGVLIEPRKDTRVGLTYISKVDLKYKDNPSFKGVGPGLDGLLTQSGLKNSEARFDFTLPNQVMLSAYHDLTQDLAVMVDLGWQNWSEFGQIGVALDTTTAGGTGITRITSANANFQDTWHTALGVRYRLDPRWSVSTGFAYDSSPVRNSDRSIVLPLDRQYRYALGLQYEWRKNISFGAAYEYMDAGSAPVNQTGGTMKGDLKGRFKDDAFNIFALNVNWKF